MILKQNIYLIRHGETEHNRNHIIQGRGVDSALNDTGRMQARKFHQTYRKQSFDLVLCSSLQRSYETVAPFLDGKIPLERYPELDEIHWGIHEGKISDEILYNEYRAITTAWKEGKLDMKAEGAESAMQLEQRLRKFLSILEQKEETNILLCSHGRTMRALICLMLGEPITKMDTYEHSNTGLYLFERGKNGYHIIRMNDRSHLEEKLAS